MENLVRRVCPYCGSVIVLNYCPIRSTDPRLANDEQAARPAVPRGMNALIDIPDELDEPTGDLAAQRAPRPRPRAKDSLLWEWTAPPKPEPAGWRDWFQQPRSASREDNLKPLTDFPASSLARRFCRESGCRQKLPPDLDDRQAHILSVVGLNAAGKTYFLATALTEATEGTDLDIAGFQEFRSADETAQRFYEDYFSPVYRDYKLLDRTMDRPPTQQTLNFRVRVDGGPPILAMAYDIAGETLMNYEKRARDASYLRRSSALIFLVDPLEFEPVREQSNERIGGRTIHQRDLLAATLQELEFQPGGRPVPVAVVISKADLLEPFLPPGAQFLTLPPRHREHTPQEWLRELKETSAGVREVLIKMGQDRLVRVAESFGDVSYHAVSALGGRPGRDGQIRPEPRRVLDPLALVLWRLSNALA